MNQGVDTQIADPLQIENIVKFQVGGRLFTIAPRKPASLIAVPKLIVRPGRLRENVITVPGMDGNHRTVLGYEDAEIELQIHVWDENQLDAVARFSELFRPKRTAPTYEPLEIVAAPAERWGIRNVYIVEIREHPWDPRTGLLIEVLLREWQPPEKRKTTEPRPISSKGGAVRGGNVGGGAKNSTGSDWSFLEGKDIAAPSKKSLPQP